MRDRMTKMEDTKEGQERQGGIGLWLILLSIGMPVLYVLSIGPVVLLVNFFELWHNEMATRVVGIFYFPLIWIVENKIEPLSSFLEWYVELFV
jgi:hypothetical protein